MKSLLRCFVILQLSLLPISCIGKNSCSSQDSNVNDGIISKEISTFSQEQFLLDQQGIWICYKYEKDEVHDIELYEESYAKEFTNHAYFKIEEDVLKAMDIYNTPIYAYRYPIRFTEYEDECLYIQALDPQGDSLIFISPCNPYDYYRNESTVNYPFYLDAPMNTIQMYYEENFIVKDRGYFFYFKKGIATNKNNDYGVPGDDRNFFRIEKEYVIDDFKEALRQFSDSYPYCVHYLIMWDDNRATLDNNNWSVNPNIKIERSTGLGKFVLEIAKNGNKFNFGYRQVTDYEDYDNEEQ